MQRVSYPDLRWYLLYEEFDTMEDHLHLAICKKSRDMGLQIASPEEAVKVGKIIWAKISQTPYRGWDGLTYPRNPRIICKSEEIVLDIPQSA